MGDYTNRKLASTIGWSSAAIMTAAGAVGIYTTLAGGGG